MEIVDMFDIQIQSAISCQILATRNCCPARANCQGDLHLFDPHFTVSTQYICKDTYKLQISPHIFRR